MALKSCPNSNKSPNLVTLMLMEEPNNLDTTKIMLHFCWWTINEAHNWISFQKKLHRCIIILRLNCFQTYRIVELEWTVLCNCNVNYALVMLFGFGVNSTSISWIPKGLALPGASSVPLTLRCLKMLPTSNEMF